MTGFCFLSVVAMRKEASHSSEMVSQLLFGDSVEIMECRPEWLRVRSLFDGYEGWVSDKQIEVVDEIPNTDCVVPCDSMVRYGGREVCAPAGASCRREWLVQPALWHEESDIVKVSRSMLAVPYLWGGRTRMGIDCSGFTQLVYKICGRRLPRDAWQQAEMPGMDVSLHEAKSGDLAFFANDSGRIVHVGIVVRDEDHQDSDNLAIIHASGEVRQDSLTADGIWNAARGCITHRRMRIVTYDI